MVFDSSHLHITNGHVFQERIRALELSGEVIAWMDVLHEGPVPPKLRIRQLTPLRALYISQQGWGTFYSVLQGFRLRDQKLLRALRGTGELTLWFEDDLYDQLQLILYEISRNTRRICSITIVQTPKALTSYEDRELRRLYAFRPPLTTEMLEEARTAWEAFTYQNPDRINDALTRPFFHLPHLNASFLRLAEEYPSAKNGLTKTENWILQLLAHGFDTPGTIFTEYQELEPSPYLGDTTFLSYIARLSDVQFPLIETNEPEEQDDIDDPAPPNPWQRKLRLTLFGELILQNEMNLLEMRPLHRWLGGVQPQSLESRWVWNSEAQQIEKFE